MDSGGRGAHGPRKSLIAHESGACLTASAPPCTELHQSGALPTFVQRFSLLAASPSALKTGSSARVMVPQETPTSYPREPVGVQMELHENLKRRSSWMAQAALNPMTGALERDGVGAPWGQKQRLG